MKYIYPAAWYAILVIFIFQEMYHKYNADKDFAVTQAEDVEAKNEFLRQRDFLERTVRTLKQQVTLLCIPERSL